MDGPFREFGWLKPRFDLRLSVVATAAYSADLAIQT
jgi:hypothetical protein